MRVYDGDWADQIIREEMMNGCESIESLIETLENSHDEARAVIKDCDQVVRGMKRGKYPEVLVDLAESARDDAEGDGEQEPEWVTKVLGPKEAESEVE